MSTIKHTRMIAVPADFHFEYSQRNSCRLDWDPFVTSVELHDAHDLPSEGTEVTVHTWNRMSMTCRYIQFRRPECIAIRMLDGPRSLRTFGGSWRFNEIRNGFTLTTFTYAFTLHRFAAFLTPFAKLYFRLDMWRRLRALQQGAERAYPDYSRTGHTPWALTQACGLTTGCSGRSAARPTADPERSAKNTMRIISLIAISLLRAPAFADSGGPYEAVPDVRQDELPPIFTIPSTKESLRYYLQHMPELTWNRKLNEPDSYTWTEIHGFHASFRVLGHIRGREVYEVRYVSDSRIEQGLDYADAILILARGFDTGADKNRLEPIYFSTGGASYDRRAQYFPDGDKYGAVKITDSWSGTGPGRSRSVFIRGTEDFRYERFTPQ